MSIYLVLSQISTALADVSPGCSHTTADLSYLLLLPIGGVMWWLSKGE